jgi:hypothetical protein
VEPSGRVQVLDPGDLLVAAVKESDAGHYTCILANEAGEVHASAYLTVLGEGKPWNLQLMSCCNVTITACAGMDNLLFLSLCLNPSFFYKKRFIFYFYFL